MDDQQFRQLLNRFDLSWSGYRKVRKGVKKRLLRHMTALKCSHVREYLSIIEENEAVRRQCELLFTVSISRFFRDIKFWQTLANEWLPEMIEKKADRIKVWSAGCACGEEVYSFKMVWNQATKYLAKPPKLDIIGTDINTTYLDRAHTGIYSPSSLKELPETLTGKYFQRRSGKNRYQVSSDLRKGIRWEYRHLLSAPPDFGFDIIFFRNNVLTYYNNRLKNMAFSNVLTGLSSGGLFIIGAHESLPFAVAGLVGIAPFSYVFRKI